MNKEIEQYINESITDDTNITDVIALRPGLGKSQYIISEISKALKSNSGLMVVTDSVERLTQMVNGESLNDYIAEYIKRNQNRIALLTADTFREEIQTASYKPVIAMTTQRFFRMNPSEINALINVHKYNINQIYIDEQPQLLEVKNIGIKELTKIDEAINRALTNLIDQNEKQQMINSFIQINESFRKAFTHAEQKNDNGNFTEYYFDSTLESASNILFMLTDKFKSDLNKYNYDVVNHLQVLSYIAENGGMVVSQKQKSKDDTNKYNNYISAVIDFRKWFKEINTKIVIFDGTSKNINPLYDDDCFNVIDCKQLEPRITKLTINIVDISASKTKLTKDPLHLKAIVDYLKSEPQQPQAIFTYQEIESKVKEITENTAHFNNIKGLNEYRTLTNITQLGLNRYPDHVYKFLCGYSYASKIDTEQKIVLSDNAVKWFKSQGLNVPQIATAKSTTKIISDRRLIKYRNRLILTDIVQNVFRSKIREQDNKEPVTYNLIFSYSSQNDESKANKQLVDYIRKYFCSIGATVNLIDTPIQIQLLKIQQRKSKEGMTDAQRIEQWRSEQEHGRIFRRKEMLEEINMKSNTFESVKQANSGIKNYFNSIKIKHGLYQIP